MNADAYVEGVRAAIPLIADQIDLLHRLLDYATPEISDLLDLGCGDGALADTVLSRHPAASAVLVDFSAPMLDHARERFSSRAQQPEIIQTDFGASTWVRELPACRSYDLIISGYAIHHLDDGEKRRLLADTFGLLRPGGMFVNLEHVAPESQMGRDLFDALFIDSLYTQAWESGRAVTREEVSATYHGREDQHENQLASVKSQAEWMRDAGFVDVDCYFKILELALLAGRKPA